MLTINLVWDAAALAAPQSFRDGVQAAANILQAAIYDPLTVNVGVGYGDYGAGSSQYQPAHGLREPRRDRFGAPGELPGADQRAGRPRILVGRCPGACLAGRWRHPSTARAHSSSRTRRPRRSAPSGQCTRHRRLRRLSHQLHRHRPARYGCHGIGPRVGPAQWRGRRDARGIHQPRNHLLTDGQTTVPAYLSTDGGITNLANFAVQHDSTLDRSRGRVNPARRAGRHPGGSSSR